MMDSRTIIRVDIGFYMGILLWPLLNCSCRLHVLFGFPVILERSSYVEAALGYLGPMVLQEP